MTAIAYHKGVLAVDSLVVQGTTKNPNGFPKLFRLESRRAWAAGAGTYTKIRQLVNWLENPELEPPVDLDDSEAIVMYDDGRVEVYDDSVTPMAWPADMPFSAGTGDQAVMVALLCGKTPVEAVELACQVNTHCGLPVHSAKVAAPQG